MAQEYKGEGKQMRATCMSMNPPSKISLLGIVSWILMLSSPFFGNKATGILHIGFFLNLLDFFCYCKEVEGWNDMMDKIKGDSK